MSQRRGPSPKRARTHGPNFPSSPSSSSSSPNSSSSDISDGEINLDSSDASDISGGSANVSLRSYTPTIELTEMEAHYSTIDVNRDLANLKLTDMTELYLQDPSYLVLRPLSAGAIGYVFKAILTSEKHLREDKKLVHAIKVIEPNTSADHELDTIDILVQSNQTHPNVVRFFQYFQSNTSTYIVMEFGPIGDLYSQLQLYNQNHQLVWTPLLPVYSRHVIHGVALGLQFLHNIGIIHGDIKLENILLFWDTAIPPGHFMNRRFHWVPKLTDFSNSRNGISGEQMLHDNSLCTLTMASPESYQGVFYNTLPADVYSVGACLLAMLDAYYAFLPQFQLPAGAVVNRAVREAASIALKLSAPYLLQCVAPYDQVLRHILLATLEPYTEHRYTIGQFLADPWFGLPVGAPNLEEEPIPGP